MKHTITQRLRAAAVSLCATAVTALSVQAHTNSIPDVPSAPSPHTSNAVVTVNEAMQTIIRNKSTALLGGPPIDAREIALVGSAMDAALTHGTPIRGKAADAAVLQAAVTMMDALYGSGSLYAEYAGRTGKEYFPNNPKYATTIIGPTKQQMQTIRDTINGLKQQIATLGDSKAVRQGRARGYADTPWIAQLVVQADGIKDGSRAATLSTLTPYMDKDTSQPGVYVAPTGRPAMTKTWGSVAPQGMPASVLRKIEAKVPPAPATINVDSLEHRKDMLRTECMGSTNELPEDAKRECLLAGLKPATPEQNQSALFWNDPGMTIHPPAHLLSILNTLATANKYSIQKTAHFTALLGKGLHNAAVASWNLKYIYNAWRPQTAIRHLWSENAQDTKFLSLIAIPPHPDYPAGHPTFSGAAAVILSYMVGKDTPSFTSESEAYCNYGAPTRNRLGRTTACTKDGVTYSITTGRGEDGAELIRDAAGDVIGARLNGVPKSIIGGDCNNATTVGILKPDFTINPDYNNSPLICPLAMPFKNPMDAVDGPLGSAESRVSGGIHTTQSVKVSSRLGQDIGAELVRRDKGQRRSHFKAAFH